MRIGNYARATLLAGALALAAGGRLSGATVSVTMGNYFFSPTNLTVMQGDTIVWTNTSTMAHDSTEGATNTPAAQRLWSSPNVSALVGSYRLTMTNMGFFPYYCLQHIATRPSQTGTVTVVAGNLPASVAMTAPASGSRHPAPPNFFATASASDPDGTVTNVFFTAFTVSLGTTNLGSAPTAPYTVAITTLPPASYQIRAVATDNEGLSVTSAPVSVLIATPVPLVLRPSAVAGQTQLQLEMDTTFGLSYVLEESLGFEKPWLPISTNSGAGATLTLARPLDRQSSTQRFYRAFIQP